MLKINLTFEIAIEGYEYQVHITKDGNLIESYKFSTFKEITELLQLWEEFLQP